MFECAFIYVAPGCDPAIQRAEIPSDEINLNVVGCSTYSQAVKVAKELVAKGCTALELCAGFGNKGIAMIQEAVGPDISVGAIKFDHHPAFGFKSGDALFDDTKAAAAQAALPACGVQGAACLSCPKSDACPASQTAALPPCGVAGANCETCPKRDFCPTRKAALGASPEEQYNLKDWMKTIR